MPSAGAGWPMPPDENWHLAIHRSVTRTPESNGQLPVSRRLGSIQEVRNLEQLGVDVEDGLEATGKDLAGRVEPDRRRQGLWPKASGWELESSLNFQYAPRYLGHHHLTLHYLGSVIFWALAESYPPYYCA